tara:strand:+ start:1124 stop:1507 length:384 start_codon:yes stop_codon:yes gene_type:complete
MAGEPPLDPPDYPELPEPDQDEWDKWMLISKEAEFWEWILEDKQDELVMAIEHVLVPFIPGKPGRPGGDDSKRKAGQALVDLIEEWIQMGDLNDFHADNPPGEPDCDGPPDRPDDDYPQHYDGTGKL